MFPSLLLVATLFRLGINVASTRLVLGEGYAGDVIKKLTLQMNRSRQASITKELIEIISGAEAV